MSELYGGIDAGGTTFKCGVRDAAGNWVLKHRVAVTDPAQTVARCAGVFQGAPGPLRSLGIASFGPLDVDTASPAYGTILKTPKPGWSQTPLRDMFAQALGLPVVVDTDVNGALLAEMDSGAARGARSAAYITVGTGIGAGIVVDGQVLGRPFHPELGHIRVRKHGAHARFDGVCPFHGDCLEGMASVTALKAVWGDPVAWDADHPGWSVAADYLAQACLSLVLTTRLERIVLGGGLMLSPYMLPLVRKRYAALMNGYLGSASPDSQILIVRPGHGDDAGLMGAVLLGRQALAAPAL